ncbi:endonuclease [Barnesiella propionica]|uniref:endonuclease I family protein n=1 Tax=Barnesiella propionica TaxID=2981781 RepID=UPI0011C90ED9|nr:endonuclease [Barnesiella propionica]MCU6769371.1 endonuclease [Barnesiella propionica]
MMIKKRALIFLAVILCCATSLYAEMPRDYYPDELEGLNTSDLKTALHKLIKVHKRIPYGANGTWVVFRKSDIRPDGSIWDMYSNVKRYFPANGSHKDMNIEHSVPKSWWGDSYPYSVDASFDLHHLVPSDADANQAKSNYILGECRSVNYNNGVTKVGSTYINNVSTNAFEPADEYKGDFARMYMYIVTCYQDYAWLSLGRNMFTDGIYPTLNKYSQDLLLKWHRQDPVSQKEVDRNNAIYSFQNNRNPFIDYPSLAEYIWGDSIAYAFHFSGSAVIAPILNVKNGDLVDFGNVSLGENKTLSVTIRGQYLTSDLSLKLEQSGTEFSLEDRVLSVDNLNSVSGAQLRISFHPDAFGSKEATLILYGNDFKDDIVLNVKALCMPAEVNPVSIDGLKASYGKNDAKVALRLRNSTENPIWYIDGKQITDGYLNPSGLSVGIHTIMFRTTSYSGKVRVNIN